MSDREDLPFISFDEDEEPVAKPAPPPPKPAPAAAKPAPKPPVDMVSRPTGRGPLVQPAPPLPTAPPGQKPMALPSAATIGDADKRNAMAETSVDDDLIELVPDEQPARSAPPPPPPPARLAPPPPPPAAARAPAPPPPRVETRPAAPPPPPPPAPSGGDDEADGLLKRLNEQHKAIEDALRNYTKVSKERDEARARAAAAEHELVQLRAQVAELAPLADKAKDLQEKLDASLLSYSMSSSENAKLKMRANELDERSKSLEQRAIAAEMAAKKAETSYATADAAARKAETALQNAKDARDDAEKRIAAALAALQQKR
jgi:hypothetical protein